jgi:hypothetical protein
LEEVVVDIYQSGEDDMTFLIDYSIGLRNGFVFLDDSLYPVAFDKYQSFLNDTPVSIERENEISIF